MRKTPIQILENNILSCHKCKGLNIPKKTMSAVGYGSYKAELMVIGQSLHSYNPQTPKQQIPFVGPLEHVDSGKLLYELLEEVGYSYKKKNLFVTNVVHCHPPDNRASLPVEIKNCSPYLIQEINIVNPQKILLLGTDAREWFKAVQLAKGRLIDWHPYYSFGKLRIFFVSVHPSYVRRGGKSAERSYREQFVDVFNSDFGRDFK